MSDHDSALAEELLRFVYLIPVGVVKFAWDGSVALVNPAAASLLMPLGTTDRLDNFFQAIAAIAPDLRDEVQRYPGAAGTIVDQRWLTRPPGMDAPIVSLTVKRISPAVHMAVLSDVTRIAEQDRALFADREKFRAILDHVRDYAIYTINLDGVIEEWNPSLERYAGLRREDVLGRRFDMLWAPENVQHGRLEDVLEEARRVGSVEIEGWRLKRDGARMWGNTVITALPNPSGAVVGFVVISRDISDRKRHEDELHRLATIDPLTGAYNRREGAARLTAELARFGRSGAPFAVMMLDIDHFKAINDRFGHAAGDKVLTSLTEACAKMLREEDIIVRWGGEEFLCLLPGLKSGAPALAAERLREALAVMRVPVGEGNEVHFTVSIGLVASRPEEGAEALIGRADAALYAAKAAGRNRVARAD